ncbi:MAG: hypothetical protein JWO87_3930, partial [Phycisphaerales bacterium]|nr:hypothetical protein [Phycisphaerales bacterium]
MQRSIGRLTGGLLLLFTIDLATPSTSHAKLAAAPSTAAQTDSRKSVRQLFQNEYADRSTAGRQALARKLLRQAATNADDLTLRFVLLTESRDLASEGGDANTALAAIGQIAASYEVTPADGPTAAFAALRKLSLPPMQASEVAIAALNMIDLALADGDVEGAVKLVASAEAIATRTGDPDIVAGVRERAADIRAAEAEYRRLAGDRKTILDMPDDPRANLAVGKYLCFQLGKWDEGLKMLARSADTKLQKLAKLETADPSDPKAISQAAEGWAAMAEASHGLVREHQVAHANALYRKSLPSLMGLEKIRSAKAIDAARESVRPWESMPLITVADSKGVNLGRAARSVGEQFLIQFDVKTTADRESVLLTKRHKSEEGSITVILEGSGTVDAAGDAGFYRVDVRGKTAVNDGQWHTITVEKQGQMMRLFVDHVFEGEAKTLKQFTSASPW